MEKEICFKDEYIEDIIFQVEDIGVKCLGRFKMSPFDFHKLCECYSEICTRGKTKTLHTSVKEIFEKSKIKYIIVDANKSSKIKRHIGYFIKVPNKEGGNFD